MRALRATERTVMVALGLVCAAWALHAVFGAPLAAQPNRRPPRLAPDCKQLYTLAGRRVVYVEIERPVGARCVVDVTIKGTTP